MTFLSVDGVDGWEATGGDFMSKSEQQTDGSAPPRRAQVQSVPEEGLSGVLLVRVVGHEGLLG